MFLEISRPEDYHAALYIRLSKEDENEGVSESVSNQKSLLSQFVRERRLSVSGTYVDDGWSGTNFDRPGFQSMIADIESGKVNMVITKDLSRLGRDYIMTGYYMERYFPEKRVRYISLLDGIDTGVESSANDITPFRAIMNDMYAKDISKKISSVKHDKQQKGLFIGGKPVFGYRMHPTEKNKIVIDEAAAQIVKRIFSMALEGLSCRKIALQLNSEGVPTPAVYANLAVARPGRYTGQWSGERISEMLRNETYIGNMVQGRRRKVNYKSKKSIRLAQQDWAVVPGTHEPIVEAEIFDRVQRLLESRRHTRSRSYDFPLKGLIYCHECGSPLAVLNRKNSKGEDCLYFVCRTYQRFTKAGVCTCHSVKEQTVTQAVWEKLSELCLQQLRVESLISIAQVELDRAASMPDSRKELAALKAEIDSLSARLDRTYMDKLSGLLEENDFMRIYTRLKSDRAALERELTRLSCTQPSPTGRQSRARELADDFLETAPTNRELLVRLVERVELTEDKRVIIKFRFREPEKIQK